MERFGILIIETDVIKLNNGIWTWYNSSKYWNFTKCVHCGSDRDIALGRNFILYGLGTQVLHQVSESHFHICYRRKFALPTVKIFYANAFNIYSSLNIRL